MHFGLKDWISIKIVRCFNTGREQCLRQLVSLGHSTGVMITSETNNLYGVLIFLTN